MITDENIHDAVEEFIVSELRRSLGKHIKTVMDQVVEDVIVDAMQQIVVKLYRNDKMKGINFDVQVNKRDS